MSPPKPAPLSRLATAALALVAVALTTGATYGVVRAHLSSQNPRITSLTVLAFLLAEVALGLAAGRGVRALRRAQLADAWDEPRLLFGASLLFAVGLAVGIVALMQLLPGDLLLWLPAGLVVLVPWASALLYLRKVATIGAGGPQGFPTGPTSLAAPLAVVGFGLHAALVGAASLPVFFLVLFSPENPHEGAKLGSLVGLVHAVAFLALSFPGAWFATRAAAPSSGEVPA